MKPSQWHIILTWSWRASSYMSSLAHRSQVKNKKIEKMNERKTYVHKGLQNNMCFTMQLQYTAVISLNLYPRTPMYQFREGRWELTWHSYWSTASQLNFSWAGFQSSSPLVGRGGVLARQMRGCFCNLNRVKGGSPVDWRMLEECYCTNACFVTMES